VTFCISLRRLHFITTSPNNRRQLNDTAQDPIPFVKLVKKVSVANYETICWKTFNSYCECESRFEYYCVVNLCKFSES